MVRWPRKNIKEFLVTFLCFFLGMKRLKVECQRAAEVTPWRSSSYNSFTSSSILVLNVFRFGCVFGRKFQRKANKAPNTSAHPHATESSKESQAVDDGET